MPTDVHQHLLPAPLIDALLRRTAPPRLVPDRRALRLELAAEPLVAAFNHGILELGAPFELWGAVALEPPRPVHGSHRPVIAPPDPRVLGDAVACALTTGNPDLVFGATTVAE